MARNGLVLYGLDRCPCFTGVIRGGESKCCRERAGGGNRGKEEGRKGERGERKV